jgi:phosphatidylethanolamine-binding protein (PEBP) family uncharacterized protein
LKELPHHLFNELKEEIMRRLLTVLIVGTASPVFAQSLSVDWEWKAAHQCNNTSPALTVSGIPDGTKSLAVKMIDLDFRNKSHGGGSIPHAGGATAEVTEGALKDGYEGPCPNNFSGFGHDYQITVNAIGADGSTVLAAATKAKNFSAKSVK